MRLIQRLVSELRCGSETHSSPTVLIVEPNPHGHRLSYVALIVRRLASLGQNVHILTSSEAVDSPEWLAHIARITDVEIDVHLGAPVPSLETIARQSREVDAKLTVVPDGDRLLTRLLITGWSGHGEIKLLIMRPLSQRRGSLRSIAVRAVKYALCMVANCRPRATVFVLGSALTSVRGWPLKQLPDPIELASTQEGIAAVKRRLAAAGDWQWVGIFGSISVRKNLDLIARAVKMVPGVGLVLAGSIEPEAERLAAVALADLQLSGAPVVRWSGTLSDEELDSVICSVDCVIAAHTNEGASGIVGKAAAAGRFLVLAGADSLRRDARTLGRRAVWSPLDADAIAENIRVAIGAQDDASVTTEVGIDAFVSALT